MTVEVRGVPVGAWIRKNSGYVFRVWASGEELTVNELHGVQLGQKRSLVSPQQAGVILYGEVANGTVRSN